MNYCDFIYIDKNRERRKRHLDILKAKHKKIQKQVEEKNRIKQDIEREKQNEENKISKVKESIYELKEKYKLL